MQFYHPSAAAGATQATENEITRLIDGIVKKARAASRSLAVTSTEKKNRALLAMAESFRANKSRIQSENKKDLEAGREAGLSSAMLDRLELTDKRVEGMAVALEEVAALPDPVGEMLDVKTRPNGLKIGHMRAPIGVIGIIYESRPNVTADAASLCLKSGNAVILRGGKEAIYSNSAIAGLMNEVAAQVGLPDGAIQLIPTTDRAAVGQLLTRNDCVDLIIPRGGRGLIEMVVKNSTIPVIKHFDGNCFVYLDKDAQPLMALNIAVNAKTQRPGVCNAAESLLMHKDFARKHGQDVIQALADKGVEVRADTRLRELMPDLKPATKEDWDTEYLDLVIAAGIVESADEAIDFINAHGSHHTEAIVSENYSTAMQFLQGVDSACVFVNCSTRFSDGGEFGMGAEIGISTDKIHARGPMGLQELTNKKFIAFGSGQVRE